MFDMPQADILGFRATLLLLPVIFLLGYYFFATVWIPRILLTLRARAWLTRVEAAVWPVVFTTSEGWPEIFLMFIQFAGLVWVVSQVSLTQSTLSLPLLSIPTTTPVNYTSVGGSPVENFFYLWTAHRSTLFFAPAATALTVTVTTVLNGFTFYIPGKQFPFLLTRLRTRLPTLVSELSEVSAHD